MKYIWITSKDIGTIFKKYEEVSLWHKKNGNYAIDAQEMILAFVL